MNRGNDPRDPCGMTRNVMAITKTEKEVIFAHLKKKFKYYIYISFFQV